MSPDNVPDMNGSGGTVTDMTSGDIGRAPMRISPKRGSPCISPASPNGAPLSATRPTEILVSDAQVWNALDDYVLPGGGGRELGVEVLKQDTRVAGDRCAVGRKAEGQVQGVAPGQPDGRPDDPAFQVAQR